MRVASGMARGVSAGPDAAIERNNGVGGHRRRIGKVFRVRNDATRRCGQLVRENGERDTLYNRCRPQEVRWGPSEISRATPAADIRS